MKKLLTPKYLKFVFTAYLVWFIFLLISIFVSQYLFELQNNFLMGGKVNHIKNPYFWSWGNFDGEHYISIARQGYQPLTHFYFPVYPIIIRYTAITLNLLARLNAPAFGGYYLSSLLISHLSFLASLLLLTKLLKLDKKATSIKQTIILLFVYPFSFFFIASYTESLFLAICLASFYCARRGNFLAAFLLAGLLTAVRIVGVAMLPALLVEWYLQNKNKKNIKYLQLIFIPLSLSGILLYMYYLRTATGDALVFLNTVSLFGAQRSSTFVLLPRVFYRYIFKIIPSLTLYFPGLFVTLWEFGIAVLGLVLLVIGFFKLRASYWVYAFFTYLIPTLSGSFSSLPRYIIIIFPLFVLTGDWLKNRPRYFVIAIYILLALNLFIAFGLFVNGYFVS